MGKNFTPHRIAFYIGIIAVWQIISMAGVWPDNIFPSPYEVAEDLAYGAADGSLFYGYDLSEIFYYFDTNSIVEEST